MIINAEVENPSGLLSESYYKNVPKLPVKLPCLITLTFQQDNAFDKRTRNNLQAVDRCSAAGRV